MLYSTSVSDISELEQILLLQQANLKSSVPEEEKKEQGFVTMLFTLEMLKAIHNFAPSIIIKEGNKVVVYAIVFLKEGIAAYPAMEPLLENLGNISWNGRPFNTYRFYIMGQICIAKPFRGMGLFEMLYQKHKEIYQSSYDYIVTEISENNYRSMRAHERMGFKTISTHRDSIDTWKVVAWDWR